MTQLEIFVNEIQTRAKIYRSLAEYVQTDKFAIAYNKVTSEQRRDWLMLINSLRINALKRYVRIALYGDLDNMSYLDLKELARKEQIPLWHIKTKNELIGELASLYAERDHKAT